MIVYERLAAGLIAITPTLGVMGSISILKLLRVSSLIPKRFKKAVSPHTESHLSLALQVINNVSSASVLSIL